MSYNPPSTEEVKLLQYAEQRQQQGLDLLGSISPTSTPTVKPPSNFSAVTNAVSRRGRPPKPKSSTELRVEQLAQHQVRVVMSDSLRLL